MVSDPQPQTRRTDAQGVLERMLALEERVALLERELGLDAASLRRRDRAGDGTRAEAGPRAELLPLIGRTLLILGGAFVIRAVTEGGLVQPIVGVSAGILYALVWVVAADRMGARGRAASASWFGAATALIAYPLLWEATITFGFLGASPAAGAVMLVTLSLLFVVWRHRLRGLSWVATVAAVATLLALAVATRVPAIFMLCLLGIGAATLWLGYLRGVRGPDRLAAGAASLAIGLLAAIVVVADAERRSGLIEVATVIQLQLGLIAVYIGSAIARTIARGRALRIGEMVVGLMAALFGLGGAVVVTHATEVGALGLGLVAALIGGAGYWAAFALEGVAGQRANFMYYSSMALVFVLVALGVLLPLDWLIVALATATVVMGWAGAARQRATLSLHGAIFAAAAASVSGLLAFSVGTFGLSWRGAPANAGAPMLVALAGAVAYCGFADAAREHHWGPMARLPRFVVISIAAIGIGGLAVSGLESLLPRPVSDALPDPRWTAILRTVVVAASAVALAWLARFARLRQAAWLVYPVIVVGGLKLLLEDLRVCGPGTLVASFAAYGAALILAPRLLRSLDSSRVAASATPPPSGAS